MAGRAAEQPWLREGIEELQTPNSSSVCPTAAEQLDPASAVAQTPQTPPSESKLGTFPKSQQPAFPLTMSTIELTNVGNGGEHQFISLSSRRRASESAFPHLVDISSSKKEPERRCSAEDAEFIANTPEQQMQANPDLEQVSAAIASQKEHIINLEAALKKRDSRIQHLEQENQAYRHDAEDVKVRYLKLVNAYETLQATKRSCEHHENRNDHGLGPAATALTKSEVQAKELATSKRALAEALQTLSKHEETIIQLQNEREQISHFLHLEIRRHAQPVADSDHLAATLNNYKSSSGEMDQATANVRSKVPYAALHSADESSTPEDLLSKIEKLEKEIQYHVQEIVLYKFDVKGYKKDIKRANAKIEKLQQCLSEHSPTSPRQPVARNQPPTQSKSAKTVGSLDGPTTRHAPAMESALATLEAPPVLTASASPRERLPKRPLTPLLFYKTSERTDTERSLADSITSSHASTSALASASAPLGTVTAEEGNHWKPAGKQTQIRTPAKSVLSRYSTFKPG